MKNLCNLLIFIYIYIYNPLAFRRRKVAPFHHFVPGFPNFIAEHNRICTLVRIVRVTSLNHL